MTYIHFGDDIDSQKELHEIKARQEERLKARDKNRKLGLCKKKPSKRRKPSPIDDVSTLLALFRQYVDTGE